MRGMRAWLRRNRDGLAASNQRVITMIDPHSTLPVLTIFTLAAATLLSEDLTCVGAGVLVAEGVISFPVALAGCFVGIVGGDVLLMLAGRWFGATGLRSRMARRLISPEALDRSASW